MEMGSEEDFSRRRPPRARILCAKPVAGDLGIIDSVEPQVIG
jgi:hypothetical protein